MTQPTKEVQVVCEPDDPNKDTIARQLAFLHDAIALETVVAISCLNTETEEDTTVIAVITKDSGSELVQYAPIGILLPPDSEQLQHIAPKLSSYIMPEATDVKH